MPGSDKGPQLVARKAHVEAHDDLGGKDRWINSHTYIVWTSPPGSATAAVEEEAQGNRGRQEACPAPEEPPQHRAKTNKQRRREEEDEGGDEEEVCRAKQVDFLFFVSSDSVGVKHQQQLEHGGVGVEGKGRGRRHHQPRGGGGRQEMPSIPRDSNTKQTPRVGKRDSANPNCCLYLRSPKTTPPRWQYPVP